MFLIYFLSFLLSWLCGMLVILTTSFFSYEEFSIIDITSFAILTFIGFLILLLAIYSPLLILLRKRIFITNLFIYYPITLICIANLPAYFLIWRYNGDLYGRSEAFLFTTSFITSAFVFGLCMAWKNKVLISSKKRL